MQRITFIGETFTRENFANFEIFAFFCKTVTRQLFQNCRSQKFISHNFPEIPIRESFAYFGQHKMTFLQFYTVTFADFFISANHAHFRC